jgi:hypothetical protein
MYLILLFLFLNPSYPRLIHLVDAPGAKGGFFFTKIISPSN